MKGLLLFIIAIILFLPLTVLNLLMVLIKYGFSLKTIDQYFYQTAIDIDRFGNHNLRTLLNATLQKKGYQFGNERETISSALGKNKRKGTLTNTGKALCKILHIFDTNHCLKSINHNL
jgi:hypothetical protein